MHTIRLHRNSSILLNTQAIVGVRKRDDAFWRLVLRTLVKQDVLNEWLERFALNMIDGATQEVVVLV